jgi:hypothetical protein
MSHHEAALAAEFVARHGVTTTRRLRKLGIGRRVVDGLERAGRVRRVGTGVIVVVAWPNTLEHRMAIACAVTGGAVRYPTAGEAWHLRKSERDPDVHVWVRPGQRVRAIPGVRIHVTRHLPDTDIVRRADGIAITSPPRTAVDASATLDADDLESLIESGIDQGYYLITTLQRVALASRAQGRPGTALLGRVIASRPSWQRAVRSDHELLLQRAMRERDFPDLVREHRVVLHDGEVIHPDLGIPDDNFFVEVDHLTWHGRKGTSANDRRRDLKARASGYWIERVSDVALANDLGNTIEDLWMAWQRAIAC